MYEYIYYIIIYIIHLLFLLFYYEILYYVKGITYLPNITFPLLGLLVLL